MIEVLFFFCFKSCLLQKNVSTISSLLNTRTIYFTNASVSFKLLMLRPSTENVN
jgi:hypothetical protein